MAPIVTRTFAQKAVDTYEQTRSAGREYTITALYTDMGISEADAIALFERLENGEDISE